ncbi:MAG: aminotransferase class [Ferruginibacter sp.]|nr:aminotransferase class [Ferruginibacter sp.]
MSKQHNFYDTVDQIVTYGVRKGILHLYTGTEQFEGSYITLHDRKTLNFGSCSYLGLEFDDRLKMAAREAIDKYGTQFSESRAYVSLSLYKELEYLLENIFDAHCVITPTTTLGHIACIPVLVDDTDAVIMDQQVHNSVQTAVQLLKPRGIHVELVRHNRMDLLEERITELRAKHRKIWYMADGIYSMFGDASPVEEVYRLMDQYPELYYYVDDAHGMSIHGTHGRGFVLKDNPIHAKMAMATSLNKAFASGGGVLVYKDKEIARKVGTVGGPLLSSGPMQPGALGAAIASAKIHLSKEIVQMQQELKKNIEFTRSTLEKYKLPVVSHAGAAIFFVGVSLPKLGQNLVARMLDRGFYVNLGVFPTVPMKQTGIRFTITRLHSFDEIESMISVLAEEFPVAMKEENITLEDIYKAFKIQAPKAIPGTAIKINATNPFTAEHYKSIVQIDRHSWNKLFEGKGTFDWNGLRMLEQIFTRNRFPEDNWIFDYVLVKDPAGNIISATFFTTALWKDDMLSPAMVSAQVENARLTEPYYLTSKVICSGSLLTEGEHLYIDYHSPHWKPALQLILQNAYALQELHKANHIVFRDFKDNHSKLDDLMVDNGFIKINMPDTHIIEDLPWKDPAEYYASLSRNSQDHLRKKVLRNIDQFVVKVTPVSTNQQEIDHWYRLYLNVKGKSLELNTFALPSRLFTCLAMDKKWEMLQLFLKDSALHADKLPCCVIFSYKTKDSYIPMIIGLDYTHNQSMGIYRQALYQLILRAQQTGMNKIYLGFSASIEKQKLGAKPVNTIAYMHTKDSFNLESMSNISRASRMPASL